MFDSTQRTPLGVHKVLCILIPRVQPEHYHGAGLVRTKRTGWRCTLTAVNYRPRKLPHAQKDGASANHFLPHAAVTNQKDAT